MKTLGSVILGTMEDLEANGIIPKFKCRRCHINYTFSEDDYCDECIEKIVEGEGNR